MQLIHTEMAFDSELNVTKAFMKMQTDLASGPRDSETNGVLVRGNSNPMEMTSE